MRNILQNPQTNTAVQVGMIDNFSKNCYMNTDIKIRILDAKTKQPLIGANVVNLSLKNVGVASDSNGYFLFKHLKARGLKTEKIQISHIGYGTLVTTANLLLNTKYVYLKQKIEQLPGVTVTPKTQTPSQGSNQSSNTLIDENNNKIQVQPSLNQKIKKSKSWIWIAVAVLFTGSIIYYSNKKKIINNDRKI